MVVDAIDVPTAQTTADRYPSVPQQPGTAITFAGRDSKILVANYRLGAQQLQYSTSEIMTQRRSATATSPCCTAGTVRPARPCCATPPSRP